MAKKPADTTQVKGQLTLLEEELAAPIDLPAAPVEVASISGPNTRVRAGNAMQRARAAAIAGALAVLTTRGVKGMTMADVSSASGLARATLYNHVRDKESLLQLVLAHEARELAKTFAAASTMAGALTATARAIAEHPALVGVRAVEPLALAGIAAPATGDAWGAIRDLARRALVARGSSGSDAQVDLLLRWLTSFVAVPSDETSRNSQASALAKSLK